MLATYMRRMRNNNLEIRIAGSSCRPQQLLAIIVKFEFKKLRLCSNSSKLENVKNFVDCKTGFFSDNQ